MKRKILWVIVVLLLAGVLIGLLNHYYSFSYLINLLYDRGFYINPRAKINPDHMYELQVWYYPFLRTVDSREEKEYFREIEKSLNREYPNISFTFKEISFLNGEKELRQALEEGNPPDIYINFGTDIYLDERLQVPVENYITEEERPGYYPVDWSTINRNNHLWGFPLLVQKQRWPLNVTGVNGKLSEKNNLYDFLREQELRWFVNFHDPNFLRQLLTLGGLEKFSTVEGKIDKNSKRHLLDVLTYLHHLRERGLLHKSGVEEMLRAYYTRKNVMIGPVNPWLNVFLEEGDYIKSGLGTEVYRVFTVNVFRREDHRGDDHTRAAMVAANMISRELAAPLAEKLYLTPGYDESEIKGITGTEMLQLGPEAKKYWAENIRPVWIAFWEDNLGIDEVEEYLQ